MFCTLSHAVCLSVCLSVTTSRQRERAQIVSPRSESTHMYIHSGQALVYCCATHCAFFSVSHFLFEVANKDLIRILGNIFVSNRVIDRWNSLDQDTVDAPSLNCFKNRLNKIRCTRMGFCMDCSSLNPRPCHVCWPQDKAAQGKHKVSVTLWQISDITWKRHNFCHETVTINRQSY